MEHLGWECGWRSVLQPASHVWSPKGQEHGYISMLHPCCLTQVVCETETTCIQTPIRWCPPVVFVDLLSIEVSTSGGIPKSSMFIGFSLINHPALGVTPIYGPPMSISEKQFCKIMFQHGRPISGHCIIKLLVISWVWPVATLDIPCEKVIHSPIITVMAMAIFFITH